MIEKDVFLNFRRPTIALKFKATEATTRFVYNVLFISYLVLQGLKPRRRLFIVSMGIN